MPDERLLACVVGLFASGALLIHLGHRVRRTEATRRREDWVKYAVYAGVINALWASAWLGRGAAALLLGAVVSLGVIEVARVTPAPWRVAAAFASALLLPAAASPLLLPSAEWPGRFAFVVVVTAATDSYAQLAGRLLGGPRPFPRLSPRKTLSGLCGGLAAAVGVSLLLGFLLPPASAPRLALLGLCTAAGAVAGDLLFSALKRRVGVKDFSALLPGHGGVLDRFDSLLLAAPAFHWASRLLLA